MKKSRYLIKGGGKSMSNKKLYFFKLEWVTKEYRGGMK